MSETDDTIPYFDRPDETKVYLVESDFGQYEESWQRIEGIFTNPAKAEEVKAKVIAKIEALKDIPEPNSTDMTDKDYEAWNTWFDNHQMAKDFNRCTVTEYTLNQEVK
jgi:hypothetical protein